MCHRCAAAPAPPPSAAALDPFREVPPTEFRPHDWAKPSRATQQHSPESYSLGSDHAPADDSLRFPAGQSGRSAKAKNRNEKRAAAFVARTNRGVLEVYPTPSVQDSLPIRGAPRSLARIRGNFLHDTWLLQRPGSDGRFRPPLPNRSLRRFPMRIRVAPKAGPKSLRHPTPPAPHLVENFRLLLRGY